MSDFPPKDFSGAKKASGGSTKVIDRHKWNLLFRFVFINVIISLLFGAMYMEEWLDPLFSLDKRAQIAVIGIVAVFIYGLLEAARVAWYISRELNWARNPQPPEISEAAVFVARISEPDADRALVTDALKMRLFGRLAIVRSIAKTLVALGLIGTVLGFIIALSGVNPESAGNLGMVEQMVTSLVVGMSVALYTTLVGSVSNIWLMVSYRMLRTGMTKLCATIIERGVS